MVYFVISRRRANLGYAFVNFTTSAGALRFWKAFDKYKWEAEAPGNKKMCEIACADIQVNYIAQFFFSAISTLPLNDPFRFVK